KFSCRVLIRALIILPWKFKVVPLSVTSFKLQALCSNYEKKLATDGKFCPKTNKPVCGTDGKTYPNLCEFCKAAIERIGKLDFKREGKC
uniref:Kazal-like domain-containing protein n=1 Tax=Sciurus vulgaris TaxID=55149 RepID=A0A8D2B7T4_SCIVU